MAQMISNQGFSQEDLVSIQESLGYAGNLGGRKCQHIRDFLSNQRKWSPYRYIVIEQYQFEEDFSINGPVGSAQSIWTHNGRFYSIVWIL